jgi:hypothetical protein
MIVCHILSHTNDVESVTMSTTIPIASLTVSELPFSSASSVSNYSLVEALSDAGVYMSQDREPRDSGRPQPEPNTVYLWENGCRVDNSHWNCTTACSNTQLGPNLVWNASSDPGFTYQNCLVYPIIATNAVHNWLDEGSFRLLEKYGIIPNATIPLETPETRPAREEYGQAWPVINRCRRDFCRALFPGRKTCPNPPLYADAGLRLGPSDKPWSPLLVSEAFTRGLNTADRLLRVSILDSVSVDMTLQTRILVGQGYRARHRGGAGNGPNTVVRFSPPTHNN